MFTNKLSEQSPSHILSLLQTFPNNACLSIDMLDSHQLTLEPNLDLSIYRTKQVVNYFWVTNLILAIGDIEHSSEDWDPYFKITLYNGNVICTEPGCADGTVKTEGIPQPIALFLNENPETKEFYHIQLNISEIKSITLER